MRRRAGADSVVIDTFKGTCRFWYAKPRVIDFEAIEKAADDASYAIVGILLNVRGEIIRDGESLDVLIRETGQRFSVDGETELSGRLHLHTTLSDWQGKDALLSIDSGH